MQLWFASTTFELKQSFFRQKNTVELGLECIYQDTVRGLNDLDGG
jgi:hypothetical protein